MKTDSPKVVHCQGNRSDTEDTVYIGRPSKWGNRFAIGVNGRTRTEAISLYRSWITTDGKHLLNDLHELKGKNLACWCSPKPCHGDVLLELVRKKFTEVGK